MWFLILIGVAVLVAGGLGVSSSGSTDDSSGSDTGGPPMTPAIVQSTWWKKYDDIFRQYSAIFGVPFERLKAIALNESSLGSDPSVQDGGPSSDGLSYGLMQLTLSTASDVAHRNIGSDDLNDPDMSVNLAAQYLNSLSNIFGNDERSVVMAYNEGPGNVSAGKTVDEYYNRFLRNKQMVLDNP